MDWWLIKTREKTTVHYFLTKATAFLANFAPLLIVQLMPTNQMVCTDVHIQLLMMDWWPIKTREETTMLLFDQRRNTSLRHLKMMAMAMAMANWQWWWNLMEKKPLCTP